MSNPGDNYQFNFSIALRECYAEVARARAALVRLSGLDEIRARIEDLAQEIFSPGRYSSWEKEFVTGLALKSRQFGDELYVSEKQIEIVNRLWNRR